VTRPLLTVACLCVFARVAQSQPKDADLAARIASLEKRVAELEAALKKAGPPLAKTDIETRLVGVWVVTDEDRKDAILTDLVLRANGTCAFVAKETGLRTAGTYQVIGRQFSIEAGVQTWN
jgi:hypothetical protein